MRIGIVGGVERTESLYREIAERSGHSIAFHSGHIGGRGSNTLDLLARGVDFLIVVTDVTSHGAVHVARRAARAHGVAGRALSTLQPGATSGDPRGNGRRADGGGGRRQMSRVVDYTLGFGIVLFHLVLLAIAQRHEPQS